MSFPRRSLEAFLAAVAGVAPVDEPAPGLTDDPLGIDALLEFFGLLRVAPDAVFRMILAGQLAVHRAAGGGDLQDLWCSQADLRAHLLRTAPVPAPEMRTMDVCAFLHCRPHTLQRWWKAGLIIPKVANGERVTNTTVYDGKDVAAFRTLYLQTPTAADLIGFKSAALNNWARTGWVPVAFTPPPDGGHYRFDKVALLAWRVNRLQVEDVMVALDVSRPTVYKWVEEGKIAPIVGRGLKDWWFRRADILAWGVDRVTALQAARLLGIHRKSFDRMADAGLFPVLDGSGPGKTWYSRQAALAWRRAWLTSDEVKRLCGISGTTLYRWVRTGVLRAEDQAGTGAWWFDRASVEAAQRALAARHSDGATARNRPLVDGGRFLVAGGGRQPGRPGRAS